MIKKFTFEGRFECGLDEAVRGKVWAFVPVLTDYGVGLGVAIANEDGYVPIPQTWCHGDDYHEMSAHADELNLAEGLDLKQAAVIVCSTMRSIPSRD